MKTFFKFIGLVILAAAAIFDGVLIWALTL